MKRSLLRATGVTVLVGVGLIAATYWGRTWEGNRANPAGEPPSEVAGWIRSGRNFLDWNDRPRAIAFLERAARLEPDDLAVSVDLASALLLEDERARPGDLVRALEVATQVLERDHANVRACRSRAQALARLFLTQAAFTTTAQCLDIDTDPTSTEELKDLRDALAATLSASDWEDERERLLVAARSGDEATVRSLTGRFPHQVRRLVEDELIAAWATTLHEGRRDTEQDLLPALARLSDAVRNETGDRVATDAVASILAISSQAGPARVADLARAHRDYQRGVSLVVAQTCDEARSLLVPARAAFAAHGSPFRHLAAHRLAVCDYEQERYSATEVALLQLRRAVGEAPYASVLGEARRTEGLTLARQGKLSASLQHYEVAAAKFASIRDEARYAGVCGLMAESLEALGRFDEAWQRRFAALARLDRTAAPRTRHQILFGAAMAAFQQGYPRAAIDFETPGVESARLREEPIEFIAGSGRLATFLHALRRDDEAQQVLADARVWLSRVAPAARAKLEVEIDATEGVVFAATDALYSVQALDRAIAYCEPGGQLRLAELYPLRGRANLEAGRLTQAETDLQAGIDFFESRHGDVFEERNKIAYRDVARSVYDEMIRFQIAARQRPDVALEYAERARARLLLERVEGGGVQPAALPALDASEIAERTPAGTALIYYALLDDRLLTWASAGGALHHVETPVDARELAADVTELRALLELAERPARARALLEQLYDLLVRPIGGSIADLDTLILLPDKALHLVPFPALRDRKTGLYLVQDHALAVALSATLLLGDRMPREAYDPASAMDALIVANPSFDAKRFALPDLKGAETEALRVRDVYDSVTLLLRDEATRRRFLDELGRTSVVHFAGHALADDERPLMSRLLLAPDPPNADSGDLLVEELYGHDPGATRLVVLAACDTAAGNVSSSEGALNLARPFLAAGIPAILATLWRIDDTASPELYVRFHEVYRETADPMAALRQAQLAMLERQDATHNRPGAWAATQVFLGAGAYLKGGSS